MVFKHMWYHVVCDQVLLPQLEIYFPSVYPSLARHQDGQLPRSRCHPEERLYARLAILTTEIRTPDEPVS